MIGQGCSRNGEGRNGCGDKGCHKCYGETPNVKATSPDAGPANSAGVTNSKGGTGEEPVTVPGVRTGVHANDVQVGGQHYRTTIQPWDFITANGIGFLEGNAIKYIARHKTKGGRQDIEKAIHYLQKLLEVDYPEEKS